MKLLHRTFSKDRSSVGIECACGLLLLHNIKNGWSVTCPSCKSEEDIQELVAALLKEKNFTALMEDIDKRLEQLLEQ